MKEPIEVKIEFSKAVTDALNRLDKAAANPRAAYLAIGEKLVVSTKRRFETSTAPDGTRWAPNKPSTLKKKKGNKPLIGNGLLAQQIFYDYDEKGLFIRSPMEYAAMQHFGGMKSQFPNLWGDIPAREFLGVSDEDEKMILNTVSDYLSSVVR